MTDLITDLRQKLANWGDARLRLSIERDEWGVTTHFVSRVTAEDDEPAWDHADTLDPLIVAAVNALPGLLDEVEAARALLEFIPADDLPLAIAWVDAEDEGRCGELVAAHKLARAANEGTDARTKETP